MQPLQALEVQLTETLDTINRTYGFLSALVCTEQGLLLASTGPETDSEVAAGLTGLFDDIVARSIRDLGLAGIDELTLVATGGQRHVIRPLDFTTPKLYLVVQVPPKRAWRQGTNIMRRRLGRLLAPFMEAVHAAS